MLSNILKLIWYIIISFQFTYKLVDSYTHYWPKPQTDHICDDSHKRFTPERIEF